MRYEPEFILSLAGRLPNTEIQGGLRTDELELIRARFGVEFPEDLRSLLMAGLPEGPRWPDWRGAIQGNAGAVRYLQSMLGWPLEGMLFDIEHNAFWDPEWGIKPSDLADAKQIATAAVQSAPVLIPIYGHRYLPMEPLDAGNPVLSVYQMDIIVYGSCLELYFFVESGTPSGVLEFHEREIRCWTRWMKIYWEDFE